MSSKTNFSKFHPHVFIPFLVFGTVILIMLPYAPPHDINRDSGIFLYAGREILLGKTLYIDVWDHKGPLIFYLNALGLLFGNRTGVWAVECIFLFIATLSGYKVMKDLLGFPQALVGTAAWLFSFYSIIAGGNYTEEFSLPISFLSILFFAQYIKDQRKGFLFLIGIAMGLNMLLRPNNIGAQLAISSAIVFDGIFQFKIKQTIKNIFVIALGFFAVLIPTALIFSLNGSFNELINATFIYNYNYSSSENISKLTALLFFTFVLGWPFWGAIFAWFIALKDMIARKNLLSRPMLLFVLIGFPLEIILDTLSGRPYIHYTIVLLPYLGLLNAFFADKLVKFLRGEKYNLIKMSVAVLCFFLMLFSFWSSSEFIKKMDAVSTHINENAKIITYVRENTSAKDDVLVWGQELSINFLSERSAPTAFAFQTFFLDEKITPAMGDKFLVDIENRKPALVVITDALPFLDQDQAAFNAQLDASPSASRHVFTAFSEFIHQNYHQTALIDNLKIFKRNQ